MPPYSMHVLNAFLITVLITVILQPLSGRLGLLDMPDGRKLHGRGVPVIGGIAMFAGILVPAAIGDGVLNAGWNLLTGLAVLVALGVIDDARDLPGPTKFAVQTAAALLMVLPDGPIVHDLGHVPLFGALPLGPAALPATVLFIVAYMNAFNMFDGLDGLAGGTAAVTLGGLAVAASARGLDARLAVVLLLLFAVLGFLVFNLRHPWRLRASVFMGDAGSLMLGAAIAYLAVVIVAAPAHAGEPPLAAIAWVLALPLIDMASLIPRRLKDGHNPMKADRRHLHHLLVDSGVPAHKAVGVLLAVQAALAAIGLATWGAGVPEHLLALALLIPVIGHASFIRFGVRWLRRGHRDGHRDGRGSFSSGHDIASSKEPGHARPPLRAPQ